MKIARRIGLAVLALPVAALAIVGGASLANAGTSTAPENIHVKVICWNSSGAEVVRHWDFIGTGSYSGGSMGDSPMRDGMQYRTLTIDSGCGLSNAVIIGP